VDNPVDKLTVFSGIVFGQVPAAMQAGNNPALQPSYPDFILGGYE
jgi:hypothetical protein